MCATCSHQDWVLTIEVEMAQPEGLWKVRGRRDEYLCSVSLDDRFVCSGASVPVQKIQGRRPDPAELDWGGLESGRGRGRWRVDKVGELQKFTSPPGPLGRVQC